MASSRLNSLRTVLIATAGAAGFLAIAPAAGAQTINATKAADISTAIGDANSGGAPIVLTTSAVSLTGAALPTLTKGVLQFGEVNSSGVGQMGQISGGSITDDANVTFATPTGDKDVISTVFGGTGTLTITGPGTLVLTSVNTFSGATTITTGARLQLGNGGGVGLLAGAIADNGVVIFNGGNGSLADFATGFTGTGALTVQTGTLELTGDSIYTGATNVASGATLQLSASGTIAKTLAVADQGDFDVSGHTGGVSIATISGAGSVALGSNTLTLTKASSVYSGTISGSGGLTIAAGTETLTGFNTFSGTTKINAGATLQLGNGGGVVGLLAGAITDNGAIIVNGGPTSVTEYVTGITGTGTLTLVSGTLELTGVNSYSGATTIDSGSTLQLGAGGGSVGLLAGAIVDNGTLSFDGGNGSLAIYSTGITGAGALTVETGTMEFGGANTYAGATTINSGATMEIIGSGSIAKSSRVVDAGTFDISGHTGGVSIVSLAGAGGVTLGSNTLTLTNAFGTYSGDIAGTGGLTIAVGTEILTGFNTFSGATTINAGAKLQLGNGGGTVGLLAGAITDNGVIIFNGGAGSLAEYATGVTGTGALTIQTGTIGLDGSNTYTAATNIALGATIQLSGSGSIANSSSVVANGTLDISGTNTGASIVSLAGTGGVSLGDFDLKLSNAHGTFSGVIADGGVSGGTGGGLILDGGTEVLTGVNTYTGITEVAGGTLEVGTAATTTAQVAGTAYVDANGTLSGYGTIGGNLVNNGLVQPYALKVTGAYTQASSAGLLVGVTPSGTTLLTVKGIADIAGSVTFAYAPGTYHAGSFMFLTSSALSGTFSTVSASTTSPLPSGFAESVSYTSTSADLVLKATTPATLPTMIASTATTTPTSTPMRASAQMSPALAVVAPRDDLIFSAQTLVFAQLNETAVSELLTRSLPDGGGDTAYNLSGPGGSGSRVWGRVDGAFQSGYGGAADGFRSSAGGIEGGADYALAGAARLGFALGYAAERTTDVSTSLANQQIFRASLYGSLATGPLGWSAALSYAHGWDSIDRNSGYGPSTSARGADEFIGAIQVAAPVETAAIKVTPAAGLQVSHVSTKAFAEQNVQASDFAVSGEPNHVGAASPYAQIDFSHTFGARTTITPDLLVGYRYDAAADGGAQALTAADGTVFGGARVQAPRGEALVGASLSAHSQNLTAFVRYRAAFSSQWSDQAVEGGLRIAF